MKKYRGRDRRIIVKTIQLLQLIEDRDTIALNPKKTSKISHRDLFLPLSDAPLLDSAVRLRARMFELLLAEI